LDDTGLRLQQQLSGDGTACTARLVSSQLLLSALADAFAMWLQVRVMVRGEETVLGDAASSHELFMTNVQYECPLSAVLDKLKAQHLKARSCPTTTPQYGTASLPAACVYACATVSQQNETSK
jgi:hypothetical protein